MASSCFSDIVLTLSFPLNAALPAVSVSLDAGQGQPRTYIIIMMVKPWIFVSDGFPSSRIQSR
jgi:hypothetical protein